MVEDETDDVDTSEDEVGAFVVSEVVAMVKRVEVSEVGSETELLVPTDETG